jgi:hypothetical protein
MIAAPFPVGKRIALGQAASLQDGAGDTPTPSPDDSGMASLQSSRSDTRRIPWCGRCDAAPRCLGRGVERGARLTAIERPCAALWAVTVPERGTGG